MRLTATGTFLSKFSGISSCEATMVSEYEYGSAKIGLIHPSQIHRRKYTAGIGHRGEVRKFDVLAFRENLLSRFRRSTRHSSQ